LLSAGRQPEVLIGTPLAAPAVIVSRRAVIAPGALRCSVSALVPLAHLALVLLPAINAEGAANNSSLQALSSGEVSGDSAAKATAGSALGLGGTRTDGDSSVTAAAITVLLIGALGRVPPLPATWLR
jgi:hypothetical protein